MMSSALKILFIYLALVVCLSQTYKTVNERNTFFDSMSFTFKGDTTVIQSGFYEFLSGMSHEFFFKTSAANNGFTQIIALDGQRQCTGHDRHVYMQDGLVKTRVWNNEVLASIKTYNDNVWHHVVHIYGKAEGQLLYIDGELVASGTKGTSDFFWNNFIEVGRSFDIGTFNGKIGEFRVWSKVLTIDEIRRNMGESIENRMNNLVLWYRFDQVKDGYALDLKNEYPGKIL